MMIHTIVSHPFIRRMKTGLPCTEAQSVLIMAG
jgi:hypothetical protein